ncbi:MAG: HAD family phosphatase [Melioribacteraceae bacterium]|jgi:HAD superfamily hydrolase (TIGR01509 family)|nr:HAD family phosphatase [Melioribacteraceae bacterium]
MKSDIKVIVFDLGNVLIPFDYNRIIVAMNKIDVGLGDRFIKIYYDNYNIHREFEKWELSNDEFIQILTEWTENKISEKNLKHIYADLFTENKETTALLPILKQNYKLVLLSNTNFIHQKYGWEKYEFLKHFDKLILSHEVGSTKPEEKIFRAVEGFTNEPSESHIFIDDIAEYVEAAKNCSWSGIQFKSHNQLVTDFKKLRILL